MPAKTSIPGVEVYLKPSTGQLILRKEGIEKTEKWLENVKPNVEKFAERMEGNDIASICHEKVKDLPKGERWRAFKACLRREGKKAYERGSRKRKE